MSVCVLDESVASRLALGRARLVEEKVELGDLAVLGKRLDERVSVIWMRGGGVSLAAWAGVTGLSSTQLVDGWVEVADVEAGIGLCQLLRAC